MRSQPEALVVLVTAPTPEKAAEIARTLVEEKLAACGNVVAGIRSIYRWDGKLCDEAEALLVLKVPARRVPELRDRVAAIHPYELPEVVALPIVDGLEKYVNWIVQSMY